MSHTYPLIIANHGGGNAIETDENYHTGSAVSHAFHDVEVFCIDGRFPFGIATGIYQRGNLSDNRSVGSACFCSGRRSGLFDPTDFRFPAGVCISSICDRISV